MVQLKANVEEDYAGGWFIRLSDESGENSVVCSNMDEFGEQLTIMGASHNNDISVVWSKNSDVTNEHFYELHQQMAKIKETIEAKE